MPPDAGGRLEFVGADAARDEWPRLHARVAQERSGMVHYGVDYWRACLADEEFQRRGASEFFHVAYLRNGGVSGLVTYRIREHTVLTVFLLGEDAEVEAELWRYCFGIDLMNEVRTFNQPTDDPLPWRLVDPRQLRRSTRDHMWLRLVDVRAALAARKYDGEGVVVVLKVLDDFCEWNEGVYRLETGPDGAKCSRTTTSADLELTAAELAAVYLGATRSRPWPARVGSGSRRKEHSMRLTGSSGRPASRGHWSFSILPTVAERVLELVVVLTEWSQHSSERIAARSRLFRGQLRRRDQDGCANAQAGPPCCRRQEGETIEAQRCDTGASVRGRHRARKTCRLTIGP